ncbi:MAG: hypothetical protein GF334_03515, partial [Candidatus Altiarchaeales archaeon]|nr:hypothetical protein [Candidatus Altiarchaeales archaeon]
MPPHNLYGKPSTMPQKNPPNEQDYVSRDRIQSGRESMADFAKQIESQRSHGPARREPAEKYFRQFAGDTWRNVSQDLLDHDIDPASAQVRVLTSMDPYAQPQQYTEPISKSRRVTHAIDVFRGDASEPSRQYYLKVPDTPQEVERALLASETGLGPKVFYSENIPYGDEKNMSGAILEERLERGTSMRKRGRFLASKEVDVFGARMAEKIDKMLKSGVIYDFSKVPETHIRILGSQDNLDVKLLDWSNSSPVDLEKMDVKGISEKVSPNLGILVGRLFHTQLPHRYNHQALAAFEARFKELADPAEQSLPYSGTRNLYLSLLEDAQNLLCEDPDRPHAVHMKKLYGLAEGNLPSTKREWSEKEAVVHDKTQLIHQRLSEAGVDWVRSEELAKGISHYLAETTAAKGLSEAVSGSGGDYGGQSNEADEKKAIKVMEGFNFSTHFEPEDDRVYLKIIENDMWNGRQFLLRRTGKKEIDNMRFASAQSLSPHVTDVRGRDHVVAEVFNHDSSPRLAGPKMSDEQCEAFGRLMAHKIALITRGGEMLPQNADYSNSLRLNDLESGFDVYFGDWSKVVSPKHAPRKWRAKVSDHIESMARLCRDNLSNGGIAWKRFENTLREEAPIRGERTQFFKERLDEAVGRLTGSGSEQERGEWARFFDESHKSTMVKAIERGKHQEWINQLRETGLGVCLPTNYSSEMAHKLNALNPVIALGVERLTESGYVEDVLADPSHAHIFVEDKHDPLIEAKLGNLDVSNGWLVFDMFQEDRRRTEK